LFIICLGFRACNFVGMSSFFFSCLFIVIVAFVQGYYRVKFFFSFLFIFYLSNCLRFKICYSIKLFFPYCWRFLQWICWNHQLGLNINCFLVLNIKDTKNHKEQRLKERSKFNFQIRNKIRLCD
jgi:hypothetical protein